MQQAIQASLQDMDFAWVQALHLQSVVDLEANQPLEPGLANQASLQEMDFAWMQVLCRYKAVY